MDAFLKAIKDSPSRLDGQPVIEIEKDLVFAMKLCAPECASRLPGCPDCLTAPAQRGYLPAAPETARGAPFEVKKPAPAEEIPNFERALEEGRDPLPPVFPPN